MYYKGSISYTQLIKTLNYLQKSSEPQHMKEWRMLTLKATLSNCIDLTIRIVSLKLYQQLEILQSATEYDPPDAVHLVPMWAQAKVFLCITHTSIGILPSYV